MLWDANEYSAAQADPQFPMPDVSDDELERVATSDRGQAVNTAFCTQWWVCPT